MEIVAMDMKLRGTYIARQLSFHGVTFKIEEVPLTKEFIKMYDDSVMLVRMKLFLNIFVKLLFFKNMPGLNDVKFPCTYLNFNAHHYSLFTYHNLSFRKRSYNCRLYQYLLFSSG